MIYILSILCHLFFHGIWFKHNRIACTIRLLTTMTCILDTPFPEDVIIRSLLTTYHFGRVGNNNRPISRVAGHIEVEYFHITYTILTIISPFYRV